MRWLVLAVALAFGACDTPAPKREPPPSVLVDINSATLQQLKALPGVDEVYAHRIVAGRPYAQKTQLRSREIVPPHVYEKIENLVIARQPP